MGGGSGGSYEPLDIEAITKAANARIQSAFNAESMILFVCHAMDEADLLRRIKGSDLLEKKRHKVVTQKSGNLDEDIKASSLVVFYSWKSEDHDFLDEGIKVCVKNRREPLFVKGEKLGSIPPYVIQYRIKTVTWDAFVEIVA